ncbi:endonuclease MutS2 [Flavilitoribacter nigricans]|uniref:Endonuclease MutS2 n=1 Tax=Flavilitoribacter nigricans (strain ATCC 23147 / DSM 23189 / NBRC 102662 / NCIMB 1420 / SS-2) TaxID=1122177 RepID=A0A2D0N311_FLAN2|nr:endonuclease MutS2 [Flavilitoribacter nigricans]PHN02932.1 endonuclease MutS2 [Flavilitoribacter nigricans DSM 23189 = NBRC 102662]
MELEPKDIYEKLEFNKVLNLLRSSCVGALGQEAVSTEIKPRDNISWINQRLAEVAAYKLTQDKNDPFPLRRYESISEEIRHLQVEGYVLSVEGLQNINNLLLIYRYIFRYFNKGRQEAYPELFALIQPLAYDDELTKSIESVIDEEGNIKPDASPELLRIRRMMTSKQKEMDRQFRVIINQYRSKGWLSDNVESFRNGRRVLSVPAEHKRKIRGIIHDESATGKTAFIEPEGIIDINNDLFDLEQEEKREIYRLLRELSAMLRPHTEVLTQLQDTLVELDLIQAKTRLAQQMKATRPQVVDRPHLGIIKGYHPLLLLKNKQIDKPTIPFDLTLFGSNRLLVLSGPNAGGKSITMKSVGLLQLMLQSGLLIPVESTSEMGIFKKFFADIGDQQSLEDDLSTYSSRLENARVFLEKADKDSLVLIDEFGSGTDPKIGGAIAEAILWELNYRQIYGVITTHYSNLKIFAFKTKGIVNGSMLFDGESLSPTYELKVGRPGSSYAFEIAQKSRLSNKVLNYARKKIGKNEKAVDELLVDLQREKQEVEEKLADLTSKQQQMEKLIKTYNEMHRDLEFRRKRLKLETKEQALQQTAQTNKEFERIIREIKEEKNLEKARKMAERIREERTELVEEVQELQEEVYYKPTEKDLAQKPIKEGDFVKMRTGSAVGTVESINKKSAVVVIGDMRMTIKVRDLQHAKEPLNVQQSKSIQSDVGMVSEFSSKLDIRGMRYEEALKVVEDFVDQALMTNASNLRIVHGKGNGVLRNAVRKKLREYNVPMDISHPAAELGGDGVTIVDM